ncbi:hypothetical protein MSAN_01312700 [Mycena sanguinolenta]|uniref:Uncharacterized protein n=1 Tax=Mycena sanguinolenta TaxID=230812 RepID=A0A8H6YA26_9AGAR|nr:hypothetical protein MSAN_01312700 [Mycena sanguinolenta]
MDREMATIYIGGGTGGHGGSGGQEGGGGGKGEGPRVIINIQRCYVNSGDLSGLITLPAPEFSQAVREHGNTNLPTANDTAQSTHDTTDETTATFRESKEYDITIVLRPNGLALQTEKPTPNFSSNKLAAHELVAWKVIKLSTGKDGTFVHLPTHFAFGDVDEDQGILGHGSFCVASTRSLVTRTEMGFWKSAEFSNPRLQEFVSATNEACHPVDFALGTYDDEAEDYFSPFLVIRNVQHGDFCIAPQCKDLMVNAYITQNIRERQICPVPFDIANGSDFPYLGEKIISAPLLGKNGRLVSSLAQRTRWLLVNNGQDLELKIIDE